MKISFLPYQPHCFAFGGFEVQTLSAFNALRSANIDVSKLNPWDRVGNFDILHCWGLGLGNYENVFWAKRSGKKVIITALFPYFESLRDEIKFFIYSKIHREKFSKQILGYVDSIVVVNEEQALICAKYYNVPEDKISVIPNIIEEIYFNNDIKPIVTPENYVLTVGNVCERKNQIRLAKACINIGQPLKIVGKCLDGEESYGRDLQKIVEDNESITWIKGLNEGSQELLSMYKKCKLFALPSFIEQQPISLLEAAACNKPLLIANKEYAKQKYYQNSILVNPKKVDSISTGITKAIARKSDLIVPRQVLEGCKAENVANEYMQLYAKLI